jgi:hydrogenase maturation protease
VLLDKLVSSDLLIIIDCAQMGRSPGEVRKFNIESGNMLVTEKMVTLHGFGFGEIIRMAQSLGQIAKCIIIGIEPKNINFNSSLSPEVRNSIPLVIQMVSEEIKKYAEKDFNH